MKYKCTYKYCDEHGFSARNVWKETLSRCNGNFILDVDRRVKLQHIKSIKLWLEGSITVHIVPDNPRYVYGF